MLDIPAAPFLDKVNLVGACVRLPLEIDIQRLLDEVAHLPRSIWGDRGGRVGVHSTAEAVFLRGFAPADGDKPIEDRPILDRLPYTRHIIEKVIPAPRMRCLLARLPAGAVIARHVDRPPYFGKTLRVHIPIETNELVYMFSRGLCYSMLAGEIWVLNNSAEHGVWNAHPTQARTHLICDFLPSPELLALLIRGDRSLGVPRPEVDRRVSETHPAGVAANG
jgi:Aspartyl/Asparaginyl beta-hydroxylase